MFFGDACSFSEIVEWSSHSLNIIILGWRQQNLALFPLASMKSIRYLDYLEQYCQVILSRLIMRGKIDLRCYVMNCKKCKNRLICKYYENNADIDTFIFTSKLKSKNWKDSIITCVCANAVEFSVTSRTLYLSHWITVVYFRMLRMTLSNPLISWLGRSLVYVISAFIVVLI